jgi:hypothetical protein
MTHQITFNLRADYFGYGAADAKAGIFDSLYSERTEDGKLSYLAGWSSVTADEREGAKPRVR